MIPLLERRMAMRTKVTTPADLFKEAKDLASQEAAIKRRKIALARKMIEAGQALGGDDLQLETPSKPKRKYSRRRARVARAKSARPIQTPAKGDLRVKETGW